MENKKGKKVAGRKSTKIVAGGAAVAEKGNQPRPGQGNQPRSARSRK